MTDLGGLNTTNASLKKHETDTNFKSILDQYLCKYIYSEENIQNLPVPVKLTEKDFFASMVSNQEHEEENSENQRRNQWSTRPITYIFSMNLYVETE